MSLYKKYINPEKEVRHEQNPQSKILFIELLNLLAITKPKINEPKLEIMKTLSR